MDATAFASFPRAAKTKHAKTVICTLREPAKEKIRVVLAYDSVSDNPVDPESMVGADESSFIKVNGKWHKRGKVRVATSIHPGHTGKINLNIPPKIMIEADVGGHKVSFKSDDGHSDDVVRFSWVK